MMSARVIAVAPVLGIAALLMAAQPALLWALMAVGVLAGVAFLAFRHPVPFCVGWLLIAGSTPEYWLGDMVGNEAAIVAVVKLAGLALAALCIARYGSRADLFNPGIAFVVMFAVGCMHGFHPNLTMGESLRTLIGSAAPYAFAFARVPRRWSDAIIRATCWLPSLIVAVGLVFAAAGLRPLFRDYDGWRLTSLGHPAFLAGFALTAVYACLIEMFRSGRRGAVMLLALNLVILVLTGARAPLALAAVVCGIAVLAVPAPHFPMRRRLPLVLGAGLLLCALSVVAADLTSIRLFNVLHTDARGLSGRETIWPLFEEAWDRSPLFGWGVGAAKMLVDPDSLIAHLLGTSAAHNEYLRVGVDGGWLGLGLLIVLFVLWSIHHSASLPVAEKVIMRLVFLAFAVHSFTDSTLIASTASVMFAWVTAVFARGNQATRTARDGTRNAHDRLPPPARHVAAIAALRRAGEGAGDRVELR